MKEEIRMYQQYAEPEMEIIKLENQDIITLSPGGEGEGGSTEWSASGPNTESGWGPIT